MVGRQQWNNSLPQNVYNTLGQPESFRNNGWDGTLSLIVEQPLTQDQTLQVSV